MVVKQCLNILYKMCLKHKNILLILFQIELKSVVRNYTKTDKIESYFEFIYVFI